MSSNKQRRQEAMAALEKELKARDRKDKARPLGVVVSALAIIVLIAGGIWFAATRDSSDEDNQAVATSAAESSTEEAPADVEPLARSLESPLPDTVSCEYKKTGDAAKDVSVPNGENVSTKGKVEITLDTSAGPIPLTLDRSVAPCTVNSFEHLAKEKYFDGTQCHRLTTSGIHVLQCGDPSGTGSGGPGYSFADEYPVGDVNKPQVNYERGTLAMANAGPGTNGSQFFLNYQDSPLQPNYTYFGTIADEGLETLDAIAAEGLDSAKTSRPGDGAPKQEVTITKATVK